MRGILKLSKYKKEEISTSIESDMIAKVIFLNWKKLLGHQIAQSVCRGIKR